MHSIIRVGQEVRQVKQNSHVVAVMQMLTLFNEYTPVSDNKPWATKVTLPKGNPGKHNLRAPALIFGLSATNKI